MTENKRNIFTTAEAAEYLGIKVWTLRTVVKHGELTPLPGVRNWLFTREALDAYKAKGIAKVAA